MHENLVRFLATKFANRGEPLEDLVQVGTIGLINAIDRFEPERGTKFSTYATPTIVGEIKRHFRDRAWNLKVPRWLQELNLQVMKANEQLSQQLGRSPTIAEIAEHVGSSEAETLDAMELGNAYETVSLDTKLSFEGETAPLTLNDSIGVDDTSLRKIDQYDDLKAAVELLDNRRRRNRGHVYRSCFFHHRAAHLARAGLSDRWLLPLPRPRYASPVPHRLRSGRPAGSLAGPFAASRLVSWGGCRSGLCRVPPGVGRRGIATDPDCRVSRRPVRRQGLVLVALA